MKALRTICFVFATIVAVGVLPAMSSSAKDLSLQNQNHVGHCLGAGNCRAGENGTAHPPGRVATGGLRGDAKPAAAHAASSGNARGGGGGAQGHSGGKR